ncbi:unnamed protein product [Effrenium voratum]|uniref:Cyclic nucleotide-binding domain-containing protein n=1 Tax=Effrenium voratum TaxID=2562239 RepID=A0AA36JPA5_9DINO|nr:unnamed protein product [Effrenium voratum]CAJ1459441.1 unnamed protein product [Effrenium voratum]
MIHAGGRRDLKFFLAVRKMEDSFWDLHRRLGECYASQKKGLDLSLGFRLLPGMPTNSQSLRPRTKPALSANSAEPHSWSSENAQQPSPPHPPASELNLLPGIVTPAVSARWNSAPFLEDLRSAIQQAGRINASEEESRQEMNLSLNVREFWLRVTDEESFQHRQAQVRRPSVMISSNHLQDQHMPSASAARLRMMQRPGSPYRAWWNFLGMTLLCYDMFVIPLRFFSLPEVTFTNVMSWVTQLYWNFDLLLNFVTGYYDAGVLILDLRKTAKHYLTTWFVFDLAVVSVDWLIVGLNAREDDTAGVARLSKTIRTLRFLRLVRMGRLVKAGAVIESLQDLLGSQSAAIHYSILKIVVRLILINHTIACFWYGIATADEGVNNWVKQYQMEGRSTAFVYFTALQWAFANLGVGYVSLDAVNLNERVFSVFVTFCSLIIFSTLVSSVTSLMARLAKMKDEESQQLRLLQRFLTHNCIDADLSHRITTFLQYTFAAQDEARSMDQLPLLSLLSKPLQAELQLQRHRDFLAQCAFLNSLLQHDSVHVVRVMRDVALNSISHAVHAAGDVIFVAGSIAGSCYFLASGAHSYMREDERREKLCKLWVAEMCLWTPWIHVGDLVAEDISRLVTLEVTAFCECVGKTVETREMATAYAKQYVAALNKQSQYNNLSDLADEEPDISLLSEDRALAGGCCPRGMLAVKVIPAATNP